MEFHRIASSGLSKTVRSVRRASTPRHAAKEVRASDRTARESKRNAAAA